MNELWNWNRFWLLNTSKLTKAVILIRLNCNAKEKYFLNSDENSIENSEYYSYIWKLWNLFIPDLVWKRTFEVMMTMKTVGESANTNGYLRDWNENNWSILNPSYTTKWYGLRQKSHLRTSQRKRGTKIIRIGLVLDDRTSVRVRRNLLKRNCRLGDIIFLVCLVSSYSVNVSSTYCIWLVHHNYISSPTVSF